MAHAQRRANAAACLSVLRDAPGAWTIRQIASRTGLSRPTVDAVLRSLVERAPVVDDHGAHASGAGRPARRFSFDPTAGCVVGLDAGLHVLRLVVCDLAGTVLVRTEAAVNPGLGATDRLTMIHQFIERTRREVGAGPLRALGVGVPGIVGADHRISHSLVSESWVGLDLAAELADHCGCPVVLDNDVKAAALAEQRLRDPQPRHMLFLQLGNRISLAVVVDGQVLQGSHRIAGELGTRRAMRWTHNSHRGQLRWETAPTAAQVFARAEEGDRAATREIAQFCAEIAPLVATIVLTVDPEVVVVGGGLSRSGATLLDPLTTAVHDQLTVDPRPPLVTSLLRSGGADIGAVGLAFEQLSEQVVGVADVRPPWPRWHPALHQDLTMSTTEGET